MGGPGSGRKPTVYPDDVIARVIELYDDGARTQKYVAQTVGLSRDAVHRILCERGVKTRRGPGGSPFRRVTDGPVDYTDLLNRAPVVEDDSGCWLWQGPLYPTGYGYVECSKSLGVSQYAHRAMYETHVGPIPQGLQIDHLCRVRQCVNPKHLEVVTSSENNRRAAAAREVVTAPAREPRGSQRNCLSMADIWAMCRVLDERYNATLHRRRPSLNEES